MAQAQPSGLARRIESLRDAIDRRIAASLPGAVGAVCATLLTGVTSSIPPDDRAAFRDSGLAHLLAVAGLHIGIVMGLFLGLARTSLALSERAALHWPCKQIAALAALLAGGGYMVLTGMHVPIIRSFAMACLFTLAVLAGRRAVSLRGLALAAVALMLTQPEQVTGVSFQMSFSAVLALIVGYELLRPQLNRLRGSGSWWGRTRLHLAALALTSALAGTASAPFGAYHFGHVQLYFVLSNMVAVPITALLVMPAGLASLALMPFGLDWLALAPMGWGVQVILWIARTTAALPQATIAVPHMPAWGLGVLALGMAWAGLWRSRLRLGGLPLIALGLVSPLLARPPDILVSADARLIALHTPAGLYVQSRSGAARFTLDAWRQVWAAGPPLPLPERGTAGDGAVTCGADHCLLQPRAAAAPALLLRDADAQTRVAHAGGGQSEAAQDCAAAAVVVSAEPARDRCRPAASRLVDRFTVWRDGAQAIWLNPGGAVLLSDRAERGDRPWVPPPPVPRDRSLQGLKMAQPETLPAE